MPAYMFVEARISDLPRFMAYAQANPALLKLSLIGPGCRESGCRWKTNRSPPRKTRRLLRRASLDVTW